MANITTLDELYEYGRVTEEWPDQWAGDMPAVSPCRTWGRGVNHDGYGVLHWPGAGRYKNGKAKLAKGHRLAYRLHYGNFPVNQGAHLCAKRACVNPEHISDKTNVDNQLDRRTHGTAKNAQRLSSLPHVDWNWSRRFGGYWHGQAYVNGRKLDASASVNKHGDIGAQRVAFERLAVKLIENGITDHQVVKLYLDDTYIEIINGKSLDKWELGHE